MARQQFGEGRQQMNRGNQARMTLIDFAQMYGQYLGRLEDAIKQIVAQVLATGVVVLIEPEYDALKFTMGQKFADDVGGLRTDLFGGVDDRTGKKVEAALVEDHKGPFDGYVKRIIEDDFGPKSDLVRELAEGFAKKRGLDPSDEKVMADLVVECDQSDNALAIILPAQARKRENVAMCWVALKYAPDELKQKYTSMPVKSADVQVFIKDLAPIVDAELERLKTARKTTPVGEAPKRTDFAKYADFLAAKGTFQSKGREKSPEEEALGEVKNAIWRLTPRDRKAEREQRGSDTGGGNAPDETTQKEKVLTLIEQTDIDIRAVFDTATMKMDELLAKVTTIETAAAYIKATTDWITGLKDEERANAGKADYANAGEKQKEWKRIENIELPKLRRKEADLKAAEANLTRLKGAAAIAAQTPDARGITTVPVGETVIGNTPVPIAVVGSQNPVEQLVNDLIDAINKRPTAAKHEATIQEKQEQHTQYVNAAAEAAVELANLRKEFGDVSAKIASGVAGDNLGTQSIQLVQAIADVDNKLQVNRGHAAKIMQELEELRPLIEAEPEKKDAGETEVEVPGLDETITACMAPTAGKALKRFYERWDKNELSDEDFVANVKEVLERK